jgi:hypothetical protein
MLMQQPRQRIPDYLAVCPVVHGVFTQVSTPVPRAGYTLEQA